MSNKSEKERHNRKISKLKVENTIATLNTKSLYNLFCLCVKIILLMLNLKSIKNIQI